MMMKWLLLVVTIAALLVTVAEASTFSKNMMASLRKVRSNKFLNPKAKKMGKVVWDPKLAAIAERLLCADEDTIWNYDRYDNAMYWRWPDALYATKNKNYPRPSWAKIFNAMKARPTWRYETDMFHSRCELYGPDQCWKYNAEVYAKMKRVGCAYKQCAIPVNEAYGEVNYYQWRIHCYSAPVYDQFFKDAPPYPRLKKRDVAEIEASSVVYPNGCVATTSCDDEMMFCGSIFDGCANVTCGACASGEICDDGTCMTTEECPAGCPDGQICLGGECSTLCKPIRSEDACGARMCGSVSNGCTPVSCGNCTGDDVCSYGQCVPNKAGCAEKCSPNAQCVSGSCVCRNGFEIVDGTCRPIKPSPMSGDHTDITSWSNNENGNWAEAGDIGSDASSEELSDDDSPDVTVFDGFAHATTKQDAIFWTDSANMPYDGKVSYTATFASEDPKASYGIVFKATDKNNFFYVSMDAKYKVQFCKRVSGKDQCSQLGTAVVDPEDIELYVSGVEMRVYMYEDQFMVQVDGKQIPEGKTITDKTVRKTKVGLKVGLIASGAVQAWNTQIAPVKSYKITLSTCVPDQKVAKGLATAAKVPVNKIKVAPIKCPQTTNKRDIAAPIEVTYDVIGSGDKMPEAVQSIVEYNAEIGAVELAESQVAALESVAISSEFAASATIEIIAAEAASAGLSAGAAAGIAVGAAAAVAIAGSAGVVVYRKKRSQQRKNVPEEKPVDEVKPVAKKPKGAGRNVFDLDPSNKQSITARSPSAV